MKDLLQADRDCIWHPYTQHKTAPDPSPIVRAKGAYLYDAQDVGRFDATSSWWCNLHGHCHPYLNQKISQQLEILDHIQFGDLTHEGAVSLAQRVLSHFSPAFTKVFYSDNGSTAVEVALKMAVQYANLQGTPKTKFLAFRNGYHGDTVGAMSVSDSPFLSHFRPLLFETLYVAPPLRGSGDKSLRQLEAILEVYGKEIAAFIFEPLVQGAAGMQMQDAGMLDQLLSLCKSHGIVCIADEVMTGFGRTGKFFACDYLEEKPDLVCLSKGLTGGLLPLSMTVCSEKIYEGFLSDNPSHAFLHGHTYMGNPIACAAAHASLDLLESSNCLAAIAAISHSHVDFIASLPDDPYPLMNVRSQGTILAMEMAASTPSGYFNSLGQHLREYFAARKILLRPLGNSLFILPPYCTTPEDLAPVYQGLLDLRQEARWTLN